MLDILLSLIGGLGFGIGVLFIMGVVAVAIRDSNLKYKNLVDKIHDLEREVEDLKNHK